MEWQWWITSAIAVAALLNSWKARVDNKRIHEMGAVTFEIEHIEGPKFRIAHTGYEAVKNVRIERAIGETQPATFLPPMERMEPGESTDVYVTGLMPNAIVVRWGSRGRRVIRFPAASPRS